MERNVLMRGVAPEIAMVSRIRVEVRGESMKAAEVVAFAALDHARLAGVLEGYVPSHGSYTDHVFNRPAVTAKFSDPPEAWGELGLPYYGRLSFVFDPESAYGGLRQFGFEVERAPDGPPYPTEGEREHGFIVLCRQRPITREHQWEGVTSLLVAEETAEEIIDDIRSIKGVHDVTAHLGKDGASVTVEMESAPTISRSADTLREAAVLARTAVVDLVPEHVPNKPGHLPWRQGGNIEQLTAENIAGLFEEAERQGHRYHVLLVGSSQVRMEAERIFTSANVPGGIPIRLDESLEGWEWVLAEEVVPPLSEQERKHLDERMAGV